MNMSTTLTLLVSLVVAAGGYAATYLNNLRIAQRKDQLDRLDGQLRDFYGPLLTLTQASRQAWEAWVRYHEPRFGRAHEGHFSSAEAASQWRLWASTVLMPLHAQMYDIIVKRADLLEESTVPSVILDLSAHIAENKALMKRWELEDYEVHFAYTKFPSALEHYASETFVRLKHSQLDILGKMRKRGRLERLLLARQSAN